ncbi:Gfo/Idh/MocA family protein [Devosia nitrariae]|uniref:3-chlorobenzoate-3,4-dioxygenase dehydrogenase n=1 Tax=Devosia nitrariae TaxID=2071872 RepID=A0ABQ5W8N7_9HYPH|nr:Gfo/Idh/MocA family oxidoreductase [Devosia nitrariae]GLQ56159.1 3-chlorobenzoate-3,4-dioxygenase dehydrogenase [Devosia nitrariae]
MNASRIYRAGAIGHTGFGDYGHLLHLPFQHIPNVEMVAIADPDEAGREKAIEESGAEAGYADYREMLEKAQLDIVSVCPRESAEHKDMILAAIAAGVHVYSDKPLAVDVAECDEIVEASEKAGVRVAVAKQSRYVEPFLTAKKLLEVGEIGDLVTMHARGKEDHRGGGEDTLVLGVHMMDLMRWFAGDPQWVFGRVTKDGREITKADAFQPTERSGPVAGDAVHAMYGFEKGVIGHFVSAANQHHRGDRWGFVLVGTKASIAIRFFMDMESPSKMRITQANMVPEEAEGWEPIDVPPEPVVPGSPPLATGHPPTRGNRLAIADLIRAVEEDREPLVSARDGRWAMEMVHGIYWSHLSGCRVPFPLEKRKHPLI